jgi:hypothetical protein
MTDDLSAAIESGYNPSSANTAIFVADLCTPSIYLAYFICILLGIKESYFNSTLTFPFIKVNSDQTSLQYKRIGCTQAAALKSSVIYWIHLLNSKCNSLIFHAYRENLKLNESLCNKLKQLFSIIGFSHIWGNQGTFSKSKLLFSVTKQLEKRYTEHWKTLLFNDDNKSGGNKLRTFRKLKTQFHLENYLCADVNKKSISTFIKIRISNSNLKISLKNSSRQDRNFEHIIVKWNSSSTPELHNLHILSSAGVFKYPPFSIFKLLLLILILTNVDIDFLFTSAHK